MLHLSLDLSPHLSLDHPTLARSAHSRRVPPKLLGDRHLSPDLSPHFSLHHPTLARPASGACRLSYQAIARASNTGPSTQVRL